MGDEVGRDEADGLAGGGEVVDRARGGLLKGSRFGRGDLGEIRDGGLGRGR